ncbi:MAG: 30S ribosomal protein S3 [Gammaproteobacteria bacterium]|nr:30S ribosomal protein S3 [Gammaproteobacteria bacterium]
MGQKVHPKGIRLGITTEHTSVWYADKRTYSEHLLQDLKVREYIHKQLERASVGKVVIERPRDRVNITIHTSRPGIVIGRNGRDIEDLRAKLSQMMGLPVTVNIAEINPGEIDAFLVARKLCQQIEKRADVKRTMRKVAQETLKFKDDVEGLKIRVSGRIRGAEQARSETLAEGRIPNHTLRANIDYAVSEAKTASGVLGVKVWIFKGEIIGKESATAAEQRR